MDLQNKAAQRQHVLLQHLREVGSPFSGLANA
jgi:hypothetical protein